MTIARWLKALIRKTATIKYGRGKAPSPRRRRLLICERLEDRVVPSKSGGGGGGGTITWTWLGSAGDGKWDTPANWSATSGATNAYPGQTNQEIDLVTIDTGATAATITIQSPDSLFVQGLTTSANDTLAIGGGSLTLSGATLNGPLTTNANATLAISGGLLTLAASSTVGGTLNMTDSSLVATGAGVVVTVNGTTTDSSTSLTATGGATLSLPGLTTFSSGGHASTFIATGTGSVLDLSKLTALGSQNAGLTIVALQGGDVNLSGLTLDGTTPGVSLDAEGSGSAIALPGLTALDQGNITLADGASLSLSELQSFTNGSLTVNNESVTLAALTDADNSSLTAEYGTLSAPNLTTIAVNANSTIGLTATGANSAVELPALTGVGTSAGSLFIAAAGGGEVDLSGLTGSSGPKSQYFITGTGAIDLPGTVASSVIASGVNTITVPQLPNNALLTLSSLVTPSGGTVFDLDAGADVTLPSGQSFINGTTFNIADGVTYGVQIGGTPSFSGLTTFNLAQNATYNLPNGTFAATAFNLQANAVLNFGTGTFTGGAAFDLDQGSAVFVSNQLTFSGAWTGTGSGTVDVSGGFAIGLGGLTLNFPGGMFQWTAGEIDGALGNAINLGTINLSGGYDKIFADYGTLDDYGTIVQTGAGNLALASLGAAFTTLKIEVGGSYLIESDSGIDFRDISGTTIENAGTIRKTGGSGTSDLFVSGPISNTGTIEADSGTLALSATSGITQVVGNSLTGGTWSAQHGATLQLPYSNITTNAGILLLGGSGAAITGISGLSSNSGGLTLSGGANFTTSSDFTNSGSLTVGAGSTFAVSGNYTQTSAGTLNTQFGGTPASGQFGQLAVTGSAALAGGFGLALVNGFGPTAGQDFKPLTYASATGAFARLTGLNPFFTAAFNPTALDLVDGSTNAVDLVASSVTAPTAATEGQPITVNWQVSNSGSQAASGSWQDSVYLSTTPSITSTSILLGATTHTSGLAAGGSYTGTWTGAVPALAPDFYYVLVQVDSLYSVADPNRSNNTSVATTGLLDVTLPALTLGKPYADAFAAADQDHYYQVTVPAGGTLVVSLASAAFSGGVGLYVSAGSLPTPYNSQEAATILNQPNQTVTVPQVLTAGTYYVLAHSVSGAAASAGYTLIATQATGLTVSAPTTPYTGGNGGNVTVEIDGTDFTPAIAANLTLPGGTPIPASAIDFVSASQIYATFGLLAAATGDYVLTVSEGVQSATSPSSFQVMPTVSTSGLLTINLSLPQYVRSGRTGTFTIAYANASNNDMVAPLLDIETTNSTVFFSTPADPNDFTQDAQVLAIAPSGPAGILRPGQTGQLTLTLLSDDTIGGDSLPVQVNQVEAGQVIDWESQEVALQPSSIPAGPWNVIFGNLLTTVGTTTDSYNAALAQAATYLGSLGETTAQVSDVSHLWAFLVAQANGAFPTSTLSSAVDAALSTPGNLSLAIERTFVSTIAGRNQLGIFGLGWTVSWQMSLSVDGSGNVTVDSAGSFAYFPVQSIGTHANTDVEYGTLALSGNIYTYTDTGGDQYVFSPNGDLNYAQVNDGNRITLGYNGQNQLSTLTYSSTTDSAEPTEQLTLTYNAQGFVSGVADGTGNTWTYSYDTAGHLLAVQGPMGLTTSYTYDTGANPETVNALLSITNPDGSQQNFTYDPNTGRLTSTSGNGGADAITYTYLGEAEVRATDAAADQTTVWYNDLGQVSRTEDPRGAIASSVYDNNGNLLTYTDATGQTYQYTYDSNSNATQAVNALGQTVQMTYNSHSDLTSITDAAGNTTQYNYGPTDNLLSITYPDGTQQSFSYDPLGNLSETVLQNGDAIGYKSNAQGLTTQETFADGTSQTMTYDAHGNLLTANSFDASGNPTGTTTLTYNAANELLSITYPNGQYLHFTYNAAGQRTQSIDQDGFKVNYTYDALGRLATLTDGAGNLIVQYTYNNLGQLQRKLNGNGTYTTYAYDAAGDLTQEVNYAVGTTVNSSFAYTYNVLGEQTSMTDASGNVTQYGYDATGQLTSVVMPGGVTIQYVYNAAGDRTQVVTGGTVTTYQSNADNEITQVGSAIYTYDENGNLHTMTDASGTTTYTYNDLNELVSISASDGSITNFQYSPLGFLVGTTVTSSGVSSQTNYLIDPTGLGNVVASYNSSGALMAEYTYGLGLVSQTGPNGTGYYDFDAGGNTAGITGSSGAYLNQYSYLPFGETTAVSATLPNPFTFAGQVGVIQIGTQLFSMRARDYTPVTGQFMSNDPTGLSGGDTDLRRYVENDPNSFVDPSGLDLGPAFYDTLRSFDYDQGFHRFLDPTFPDYVPAKEPAEYNNQTFLPENANNLLKVLDIQISQAQRNVSDASATLDFTPDGGIFFFVGGGMDGDDANQDAKDNLAKAKKELNELVERRESALRYRQNLVKRFNNDGPQKKATNTLSHDPNALIGPAGFGTQNFLTSTGTWPYTIDFENDGSAAAQDVTVTQQLDPNLDWATFQLGSFGFGPVNVVIPVDLTQYQTTVSYQNSDGTTLNVLVDLDFNVQTGLLTATFTSLDPQTGEDPAGVFDGFLYPENGTGVGEGYVQYTVQPKANLATGTTINQQASVVFDTNAPLATDSSIVTIDSGAPSSSVTTLPAYSMGSFTVAWSGQDDTGGSGIASFDVYVSDDNGPFTLWQQDVTQTSATFTGQNGHTYGFYSVATDNVGNVQPAPSAAQATTIVDTIAPTSNVTTLPTFSPGSFILSWSGSDDTGGSGLASFSVYLSDNGGTFTPLLTNTTKTSTTFTGQNGHVYGFYSIATDGAGNVQPAPKSAQATTTVDSVAPTSSIAALPAYSLSSFTLTWSGSDNTGGSGLASFSIFVSDNGAAFTPLLTNTTLTSMTFNGQNGHTYAFYSVATDVAGNVQPAPKSPQATTTVDSVPPTSSVNALPAYSLGSFTLSWSGSDNAGGSGLASFSIFVSDNGGAFTPLLTDTTQTSTTFNGQNGHTYGFYSIATDVAGNVQPMSKSAQASTTVESVPPPAPSITSGPGSTSSSSSATFVFSDSQGGVTFLSKLDNGSYAAATSPQTLTGLGNGSHTFYVEAKDQAGNIGSATSYNWTISSSLAITSAQIDDGTKQRSMVRSLTLTFNASIASTLSGVMSSLTLIRASDGLSVGLQGALDSTGKILTLTFTGSSIVGGSLADGRYTLSWAGTTVLSSSQLWRLFGDLYGTASVTSADLTAFSAAMNSRKGMSNYSAYFDYDENGLINNSDQTMFNQRMGTSI